MTTIVAKAKFLFDADFGPGGAAERPVAAAEHTVKLAEAESKGYRDGYAAAENEKVAEAERRIAAAFEQIGDGIDKMARGLAAIEARLEAEAVEVAVAVGRKLAPALIEREPLAEMAALTTDCLKQLVASPHVAVRGHDSLQTIARERLETIARDRGFEGRLIVIADPEVAAGDCRIDWADGGLVRERAATEKTIAMVVGRYIVATRGIVLPELGEITT
jgi:flagellar assembly protein FliH